MKLPKINQRGDAGTIVVAVIGVALIGAVVYFAYQNYSQRQTKASPSPQASSTPTPTPSIANPTGGNQALVKAKELYTAYAKSPDQAVAKPYVAPEYLAALYKGKAYDPVLCTQGSTDGPLKYALMAADTASAKIQVKQTYAADVSNPNDDYDNVIDITVRMSDMLITDITCNFPK